MKTNLIILIILISISSCTNISDTSEKEIKKEKILYSETTHKYITDKNNRIIRENVFSKYYTFGKIDTINEELLYEYNSSKNLIIIKSFWTIAGKKTLSNLTYKYKNYVEQFSFNEKLDTTKYLKEFYENGLRYKLIFYFGEDYQEINIFKYNKEGKLIKNDIYSLDNKYIESVNYTYKKYDNIIYIQEKNSKGKLLMNTKQILKNDTLICEIKEVPNQTIYSHYYSNNQLVKSVIFEASSKTERITENKYDSFGRLIEEKNYKIQ